jgi:hypothetical protein
MTEEEIKTKTLDTLKYLIKEKEGKLYPDSDVYNVTIVEQLFVEIYDRVPYIFNLSSEAVWSKDCEQNAKFIKNVKNNTPNEKILDRIETANKIIEVYDDCFVYRMDDTCIIVTNEFIMYGDYVYSIYSVPSEKLLSCKIFKKFDDKPTLYWVYSTSDGGIDDEKIVIDCKGNIEDNYNDDLPDEKINKILNEDSSSILIFHGKPGCGKTSYIRSLIKNNKNKNFYWLDPSMFSLINSSEFMSFITQTRNSVYILEDCESLLSSREIGNNGLLSSLLNISDGLLGDSLHLKFICTFNTEIGNIDPALLRKGRLKMKYEFKDLDAKKVKKLFKELGLDESKAKSMPLCDVYNFEEDNGVKQEKTKIGF